MSARRSLPSARGSAGRSLQRSGLMSSAPAGNYIFERGDVIRDGDTIEGMEPGEKWRCLQEEALIPPDRLVIDLDPGEGNAAGQRFR
jgi:hypothetical protein